MRRFPLLLAGALAIALTASACGDDDTGTSDRGGGALGGSARTSELAATTLDSVEGTELAWRGFELDGATGAHDHGPAFVYARNGPHVVTVGEDTHRLDVGEVLFVPGGAAHTHEGDAASWEILLEAPRDPAPAGTSALFESPPLEGVPDGEVELRFIRVEMPSQSQTSIHTHPGPEYIYVTEGEFEYQNALIGTKTMGPGDDAALPADTAVQKRNPRGPTAVFLSWFVVAAGEPFAPAAEFTGTTGT